MNAVAVVPQAHASGRSLSAVDLREHVNLIQEVMQAVMKKDTHYGVIPGCKQPSLYKAGSEVLLTTFRIAVSVHVEDLSTPDCIRYRVRTVGTHQGSGVIVGEGIGECSSDEEKYKWRRCFTKDEFDLTPESRRRFKFTKYGKDMQVRTEPADVANTVLKMGKKRAQIDLTLTATAASDIFTQDVEDIPEELRERHEQAGAPQVPKEYPSKDFDTNFPKWRDLITSDKRSAAEIIAMVESKGTLTEAQRNKIKACKKPIEGEFIAAGDSK